MARKKNTIDTGSGLDDLDLDLDMDLGDWGMEGNTEQDKKPIRRIARNFAAGAKMSFKDPTNIRNTANSVLPDGYGTAVNTGFEVYDLGVNLYNSAAEELRPALPAMRKAAEKIASRTQNFLPKRIQERLEEFAKGPEDAQSARYDADAEMISGSLAEIFGTQMEEEARQRDEDRAEEAVRATVQDRRAVQSINISNMMLQHLERQVTFQDTVFSRALKKQLELQYRQTFYQRDILQTLILSDRKQSQLLAAIMKNTGLPDSRKSDLVDLGRKRFRELLIGSAQSAASRYVQDFTRNFTERMTGNVRNLASGLAGAISAGEQAGEMGETMGDYGMDRNDMAAQTAGQALLPILTGLFGRRIRRATGANRRTSELGHRLNYLFGNLPTHANTFANRSIDDYGVRGMALRMLQNMLPRTGMDVHLSDSPMMQADKAAEWDQLSRRSLIEIIPGWLSRIHHENRMLREHFVGQKETTERMTYNVERGEFTTFSRAVSDVTKRVKDPRRARHTATAIDRMVQQLVGDNEISEQARQELKSQILTDAMSNIAFDPVRYYDSDSEATQLSYATREELRTIMEHRFFDINGKQNWAETDRAMDLARSVRNATFDPANPMRAHMQAGNRELLDAAGLLVRQGWQTNVNSDAFTRQILDMDPDELERDREIFGTEGFNDPAPKEPTAEIISAQDRREIRRKYIRGRRRVRDGIQGTRSRIQETRGRLQGTRDSISLALSSEMRALSQAGSITRQDGDDLGFDPTELVSGEYIDVRTEKPIRYLRDITGPVADRDGELIASARDIQEQWIGGNPHVRRALSAVKRSIDRAEAAAATAADSPTSAASARRRAALRIGLPFSGRAITGRLSGFRLPFSLGRLATGAPTDVAGRGAGAVGTTFVSGAESGGAPTTPATRPSMIQQAMGGMRYMGDILTESGRRALTRVKMLNGDYRSARDPSKVITSASDIDGAVMDHSVEPAQEVLTTSEYERGLFDANMRKIATASRTVLGLGVGLAGGALGLLSMPFRKLGGLVRRIGNWANPRNRVMSAADATVVSLQNLTKLIDERIPKPETIRAGSWMERLRNRKDRDGDGKDKNDPKKGIRNKGMFAKAGGILSTAGGWLADLLGLEGEGSLMDRVMDVAMLREIMRGRRLPRSRTGARAKTGGRLNRMGRNRVAKRTRAQRAARPINAATAGRAGRLGRLGRFKAPRGLGPAALAGMFLADPVMNAMGVSEDSKIRKGVNLGLTGAGIWSAGSAIAGIGAKLGLGALAGTIGLPALAIGAVAGAVGYAAFKGYKKYKYGNYEPLRSYRLAQYGIAWSDASEAERIVKLEQYLEGSVVQRGTGWDITNENISMEDVEKEIGIDDGWFRNRSETRERFWDWFNSRFKPVYLKWVSTLKAFEKQEGGKAVLLNDAHEELTKEKQLELLRAAHGVDPSVYAGLVHPFDDDPIKIDADDIESLYRQALSSVESGKGEDSGLKKGAKIIATVLPGGFLAVKAMDHLSARRRRKDAEKDPERMAALMDDSQDSLKREMSGIAGMGVMPPAVMAPSSLTALESVRMRAYGLTEMRVDRVTVLRDLETYMFEEGTSVSGSSAKLAYPTQRYLEEWGPRFGVDPGNDEQARRWRNWFEDRFSTAFLAFRSTLALINQSASLKTLESSLTPANLVHLAQQVIQAKVSRWLVLSKSIWTLLVSPWAEDEGAESLNGEMSSCDEFMRALRETKPKEDTVNEVQAKAQSNEQSSNAKAPKPRTQDFDRKDGSNSALATATAAVGGIRSPSLDAVMQATGQRGQVIPFTTPLTLSGNAKAHELMLTKMARDHGISDPTELSMFLAHTAHESGRFKQTEENLRYGVAALMRAWPNRFKDRRVAQAVVDGGPVSVADAVYEGREGLGNTQPGDGYRFRGRGFIQLTGRANYQAFQDAYGAEHGFDVMENPDLVATDPKIAALSAIHWWKNRGGGLRAKAAAGDVPGTTQLVNGGQNGLADRQSLFRSYSSEITRLAQQAEAAADENFNAPVEQQTFKPQVSLASLPGASGEVMETLRPSAPTSVTPTSPSIAGAMGFTTVQEDARSAVVDSTATAASEDVSEAAQDAADYATQKAHGRSQGLCARYVANALERSGYEFNRKPSAYMYGDGEMAKMGFTQIEPNTPPAKGDVQVIANTSARKHGHIQIFNGRQWVSDFLQKSDNPYSEYIPKTMWRDLGNTVARTSLNPSSVVGVDANTGQPHRYNEPVPQLNRAATGGSMPVSYTVPSVPDRRDQTIDQIDQYRYQTAEMVREQSRSRTEREASANTAMESLSRKQLEALQSIDGQMGELVAVVREIRDREPTLMLPDGMLTAGNDNNNASNRAGSRRIAQTDSLSNQPRISMRRNVAARA